MAEKTYKGKVKARIVELRFASSGKLAKLNKKRGDTVKKGELIASLDKKLLQIELDRQLGDYEKKRAEFEIFNIQKGEPQDDLTKYLKSIKQAELNVSVKDVEIAKAKLDQADLFSPVEGIIIDDSNLVPGIYITPASGAVRIIDTSSYYFEVEIDQENLKDFLEPREVRVEISGINKKYSGKTRGVIASQNYKFLVETEFGDLTALIYGLEGKLTI